MTILERTRVTDSIRQSLTYVGAGCSTALLATLSHGLDYLWVGQWMRARRFEIPRRLNTREQLFKLAAHEIRDRHVPYLEFGVYRAASLRQWSRLLRNPDSRLHAFDSFDGLPETWDFDTKKGHFTTGGLIPVIDDSRITYFKGLFSDTLTSYRVPPHQVLFVTLDADLYSSTKTVLDFLKPHVAVGTYFYFDEFQSREHELKAFDEFLTETGFQFRVMAANRGLSHVLFQCVSADRRVVCANPPALDMAAG